jgi:hypothetical protein
MEKNGEDNDDANDYVVEPDGAVATNGGTTAASDNNDAAARASGRSDAPCS